MAPLLRSDPRAPSPQGVARALLAPLFESAGDGWEVIGWDAEQGIQLSLRRGDAVILVELERRDDSRSCYARTARFNVCARPSFDAGADLDEEARAAVNRVVEVVQRREPMLPAAERPAAGRPAMVREIEVERILIPEGKGHYFLNPYVGCMIGCAFCYVAERADLSRELAGLPALPWGRYVDVKVNAAQVLRREVKAHPPGIVRMSPILTDPYQPLEGRYRVTRACLEVLLEAGFSPVVLTRAARVTEDLDLLAHFSCAAVGLSIPTDDDEVRRRFEPGADSVEERFLALERLHAAGVTTFGVVQPVLPMDPERLVARMAPLVRAVRVDRMQCLDLERVARLYAFSPEARSEGFFARTIGALRAGFAARGVAIDERDDLPGLLFGAR